MPAAGWCAGSATDARRLAAGHRAGAAAGSATDARGLAAGHRAGAAAGGAADACGLAAGHRAGAAAGGATAARGLAAADWSTPGGVWAVQTSLGGDRVLCAQHCAQARPGEPATARTRGARRSSERRCSTGQSHAQQGGLGGQALFKVCARFAAHTQDQGDLRCGGRRDAHQHHPPAAKGHRLQARKPWEACRDQIAVKAGAATSRSTGRGDAGSPASPASATSAAAIGAVSGATASGAVSGANIAAATSGASSTVRLRTLELSDGRRCRGRPDASRLSRRGCRDRPGAGRTDRSSSPPAQNPHGQEGRGSRGGGCWDAFIVDGTGSHAGSH